MTDLRSESDVQSGAADRGTTPAADAVHRLGPPQEGRHAFELLQDAGLLDAALPARMARMVGFRNVAVHDYQRLNLDIVQAIIRQRLDFRAFGASRWNRPVGEAD